MTYCAYNMVIAPGRLWTATFTYRTKSTGALIDLTGYTAELRIGDDLTLTDGAGITLGGVAGTATVVISAVQTAALVSASGVYELDVISGGGVPVANEPLQGAYTVEPRPGG